MLENCCYNSYQNCLRKSSLIFVAKQNIHLQSALQAYNRHQQNLKKFQETILFFEFVFHHGEKAAAVDCAAIAVHIRNYCPDADHLASIEMFEFSLNRHRIVHNIQSRPKQTEGVDWKLPEDRINGQS